VKRKAGAMVQEVYDQDALVPIICQRVSHGEFVTDVLKDLKISAPAFYEWVDAEKHPARAKAYARAKVAQSVAIADEIQAIADGEDRLTLRRRVAIEKYARQLKRERVPQGIAAKLLRGLEQNLINRNRLQVDARKWYARSLNPKEFGDKVDMTSGGEPMKPANTVNVQFVGPDGAVVKP
jgi:hypothetical protein